MSNERYFNNSTIFGILFQNSQTTLSLVNCLILLLSTLLFLGSFRNLKRKDTEPRKTEEKKKEEKKLEKEESKESKALSTQSSSSASPSQSNKPTIKLNISDLTNPISSDEEESSSPSPSPSSAETSSFLSPLNYTTGRKNKHRPKKNQSYYVSTYYSGCKVPDQTAQMDTEDEFSNSSSPELKFKQHQRIDEPQPFHQYQELEFTSNKQEKHHPINDILLANPSNIINESTSLNLKTFVDPKFDPQISLDNQETCTKKLKRRKCILPQVLELHWKSKPKKVLIIKKYNDPSINELIPGLVDWLEKNEMTVIKESDDICDNPTLGSLEHISDPYSIDFIISMGGDGTILHTSSLFKTYMPPILSFSMGSLGFLTAFDYQGHQDYIKMVLEGKCFVSYRLRLSCTVISGSTKKNYQVLNEVSIDRGTNPYLSNLECSCDDRPITIVQADGLIIATSTGSTAYSLSAGGSLVHPTLPAVLITPICPHTLSFRPVVLPSTSKLAIRVPEISRCTAWASFDGKSRQELKQGDQVIIKTSKWAVPVICKTNESCEWFEKLADNLNWNVRTVQKSFKNN